MIRLSDTENVDAVESTANDTHRASDGTDHANVVLSDTHRVSDGQDHSDILANLVDIVIVVPDVGGGGTDAALTVDILDLTGGALAKLGVFKIVAADAQYEGIHNMNANVAFINATAGAILATAAGWAVVQADAAGQFACTAQNAVNETVWFSCTNCDGGHATAAEGIIVRGCLPDDVTWS